MTLDSSEQIFCLVSFAFECFKEQLLCLRDLRLSSFVLFYFVFACLHLKVLLIKTSTVDNSNAVIQQVVSGCFLIIIHIISALGKTHVHNDVISQVFRAPEMQKLAY